MKHINEFWFFFVLLSFFEDSSGYRKGSTSLPAPIRRVNMGLRVRTIQQSDIHSPQTTESKCEYNAETVVVTGDVVKLSSIVISNGRMFKPCRGTVPVKILKIYAFKEVIFDSSFYATGLNLNMVVIAPEWHIVGSKVINLNGNSPSSLVMRQSYKHAGEKGGDGSPGLPGEPGGNFLGIFKRQIFNSTAKLTVTVNGGNGAAGQNGENGGRGRDGENAARDQEEFENEMTRDDKKIYVFYSEVIETHRFYGKSGQRGANGGDGGKGGYGGQPGTIKVFSLTDSNTGNISITALKGSSGSDGDGGAGGVGGMPGKDLEAYYCKRFVTAVPVEFNWCIESTDSLKPRQLSSDKSQALRGVNGITGANLNGIKLPNPPKTPPNVPTEIADFKKFMLGNLNKNLHKQSALQFLQELYLNKQIIREYTTLDVLSAVYDSVTNSPKENTSEEKLLVLDSLFKFTLVLQPNTPNDKIAIATARTALVSKKNKLIQRNSQASMIVNLLDYLKLAKENIEVLRNLEESNSKLTVVNRQKNFYNKALSERINEANEFIKMDILPTIELAGSKIQNKIYGLVHEIENLQSRAIENRARLIEEKTKLERTLVSSSILSVISSISPVIGDMGAAAANLIHGSEKKIDGILSNDELNLKHFKGSASLISSLKIDKMLTEQNEKKLAELNGTLEILPSSLFDHPEKLKDTLNVISADIKSKLEENGIVSNMFESVNKALDSQIETLENKALETDLSETEKNVILEQASDLKQFKKMVKIGSVGLNLAHNIVNNIEKRQVLEEAVESASDKINALESKRSHMFEQVLPMITAAQYNFNSIALHSANKSHVGLDITKWRVQSTLRDMKLQFQDLTKGFDVENDLIRTIEKLEESMTILINIYDRIQSYTEQQELANFLSEINSPIKKDVSNTALQNATELLDIEIRTNIILQQHKLALFSLKQQVFPFAHTYLAKFAKFDLEAEKDFQAFTLKSIEEIKTLESDLAIYKSTLQNHDKVITCAQFANKFKSSKPFFSWKQAQFKDAISKLLKGEEVVFQADIRNSSRNKDAIKFSTIDLHIFSVNDTMNSEIQEDLKRFILIATHLGNSYYRFRDKIYLISGDPITIEFSFERDENNLPVHRNNIYDKIKSGDVSLSPFTFWKFKLIAADDDTSHNQLLKYKDNVDLHMNGHACFLSHHQNTSAIEVDKYYTALSSADFLQNKMY